MRFSLAPLLIHGDDVPAAARRTLLAAHAAAIDERTPYLESAARILHRELDLDCSDARELVGLTEPGPCR
jgi:hypothetical protein